MTKFVYPFGNLDRIRIPGTLHQLGTPALSVTLWDTRNAQWRITPVQVEIDPATFDVLLLASQLMDGVVVLIG